MPGVAGYEIVDSLLRLVLSSLNTVTKETAMMARELGRASPDPRLGSMVELSRGSTSGLLDFVRVGKALPGEGIAAEEAPPALLQVQPACPCRNEDLMDARMLLQPRPGLEAVMAAEVIGDNEDVACGVISFNVSQQGDVTFRVARESTPGQLLAIAHP